MWVGTGENNSQRSVGYGDGVYKSEDGGKSWKNVGLKASEHIGKILVHPEDSNVVYVAAQGPLWAPGGDRGLYKTTDGGKTWNAVLTIDENTGVTDVVMDPRDPDTLIAASYQRRRHVFTLIDGGPGSGVHKTTDGGKTWKKITSGLPKEEMGRIGLAIAPTEPDTVYALVETAAANKAGGTFRSTNRGETWEKRGDYIPGGPMYYQEIFVDPKDPERLYSMDVFLKVSDDAGKTWRNLGERYKHVDNHAIWIDPDDTDHYLVGGDGGLYQSFDRGATWQLTSNLPVTQFYRVDVDNSSPVYFIYGGTQDNNTLGGPSRTLERPRHRQPRLVRHLGRRRLPRPHRPHRPQHRLLDAPARRPRSLRPERAAKPSSSSPTRSRATTRCAGTGTARSSSRPTSRPGSTSRRSASSAARTAATAGRRSARTSPGRSTATS